MADISEKTITDELREAAARAREDLVPAAEAHPIPGSPIVAVCGNHVGISAICDNCVHFDARDMVLARLIVVLINAREPLASWLEKTAHIVDSFRLPSHPEHEPCDDPCCYTAHHALAVARVLNGGDRG
jgi:hypothetical protein